MDVEVYSEVGSNKSSDQLELTTAVVKSNPIQAHPGPSVPRIL